MLTWAYPYFELPLAAAALALLLVLAYVLRTGRLARALGRRAGRLAWKLPLRLPAGALLLLAWLGPARGVSPQPVRTAGKDLWLVVDVSRSMDAPDVAPSRLLRAQAELQTLVEHFPADRLGLVVFGSQAVVQCPLTYDQEAVQTFLNTLSTSLLPPGPTALRVPLELVLARLAPAPGGAGGPGRATAVVVVSDGEDFGENLEPPLRALARSGARVFAVGVGTAAGARLPLSGGRLVRDAAGRPVTSRLREAPLLQLAAQTGGQYVALNDRQNGFPALLADLRAVQGPTEQVRTVAVADNRYRLPLGVALVLLALDVALTVVVIRP
ncbi:VWA domain-containing protein [Hymenobacter caeli]|uniref:Ca-activated chloride channel family protein n=1 Tax=Hymenobacter caeli TaxID=2735894 RepID=A0ABX2FKT6_9BACT|nr:VWA domain-containing protein [Hymenobacter caeli]NRT17714.1 Ca-activated chloride channel family protein [Hymenobacter caeli]